MSRFTRVQASSNLALRPTSPMDSHASAICTSTSCRRRMARTREPSKTWVIFMSSRKEEPVAQLATTSIISGRKLATYSSTSSCSLHSTETLATRRAVSLSAARGPSRSSRTFPDLPVDFSCHTRHETRAAACTGSSSLKTPSKTSSVTTISSALLMQAAKRPLRDTRPSPSMYSNLLSTLMRALSSSFRIMLFAAFRSFMAIRTASCLAAFSCMA
mmetsp:Transcript_21460/g.59599  ORF Transcript_21460/g.59599 Transcript_21460/m.59599 type:complete len:216 (+) Transcript_21460:214-861(+)